MADISERAARPRASHAQAEAPGRPAGASAGEEPLWYIEAFFLAYRDFVGESDRILAEIGFGRAHHRVLYFVNRYPGMRVADLLEILQITKQSLARVLRELVREGYVLQLSGQTDRRERLLYATEKGGALTARLTELQRVKIQHALSAVGPEGAAAVAGFLKHMAPDAGRLGALKRERQGKKPMGEEA